MSVDRTDAMRSLDRAGVRLPGDSAPAELVDAYERRVRRELERLRFLERCQRVDERELERRRGAS